MQNLSEIKERFLNEPPNRRLGHLASDLLRISNFIDTQKNAAAVNDLIEESKFFIEWAAPESPSHIQEFFSEIQPKLALWQRRFFNRPEEVKTKEELKKHAKAWSGRLIEFSGLRAV